MTAAVMVSPSRLTEAAAVLSAAMPEVERVEHEALGMSPFASLLYAARESERDGELIHIQDRQGTLALAGVAPGADPDVGVPWAAIDPRAWRDLTASRRVMRESKAAIGRWRVEFASLTNVVAAANVASGRYLEHLGFKFSAPFEVKLANGRVESFMSFSQDGLKIRGRF